MALGGPGAVRRSAADARVRSARLRHISHNERTPAPWGTRESRPRTNLNHARLLSGERRIVGGIPAGGPDDSGQPHRGWTPASTTCEGGRCRTPSAGPSHAEMTRTSIRRRMGGRIRGGHWLPFRAASSAWALHMWRRALCGTVFSPASGDARGGSPIEEWPASHAGRAPPACPGCSGGVVDADVLADVAAGRAREQGPAPGIYGHGAPGGQAMVGGRARVGSGPLAQRLRGRRRERIGDPSLDRTLRHRSYPERD